jgi:hypothetical protein
MRSSLASRTRPSRPRRPRNVLLELLEDRRLLSTLPMGSFSTTVEVDDHQAHDDETHGDAHHHDDNPYQIHYINNVPQVFTWEPKPADAPPSTFGALVAAPTHPLTSIPLLHSNPGAKATLFLDFDGHFEPVWGAYSNITTPVYDIDGDPTTFSDRELSNMSSAWEHAAEDYAPFNVDVTTAEPAVLAEGAPIANANGVAMRAAIGGTSDWYGAGYGGVAYINSFTSGVANVAYVFAANDDNPAWIGDTVSHESGHTFGLQHQSTYDANGVKVNEYNHGDTSWAPIMGTSYYTTSVTTWYNGTSSLGATTYQDDMAVIVGTANGFGFKADDRGNTQATASPLSVSGNSWTGSGLVGQNSDSDVFSFHVSTEDTYRTSVTVASAAPNLDSAVEIRNSAGVLLGSASPATSRNASVVKNLTPGDYFVTVKTSGVYGWVGQYTVKVDAPSAGITVTQAAPVMNTYEDGRSTSFTVALDTRPLANVTIPVGSSNTAEGTVSVASLVFTPTNWDVPQTVTATGVGDGLADGDSAYLVTLGAAVSTDPDYSGRDAADVSVVNVDVDSAGYVYRVDNPGDSIERLRLDGSQPETLVSLTAAFGTATGYSPSVIAVDTAGGKVYWTDSTSHTVSRSNLDGSGVETVVPSTVGATTGIALDTAAGKMYWVDYTNAAIRRANLDGTGVEVLVAATGSGIRSIALDVVAGKMYWTDLAQRNIQRANLDGTGVEIIWAGVSPSQPTGIALDVAAGKLYWSDNGLDQILRADLGGTNAEVLVQAGNLETTSNVNAIGLDLPAGKLYWTDASAGKLYRANLDGSAIVLLAKVASPFGLAVVHPGPAITVTHRTGLVTTEAGGTDVFRVSLTTKPTSDVTIPVNSSLTTEGTVSTSSLTFTPANWNVPQVVTVKGVDDPVIDGDKAYTIVLGAAVSADPVYNGLDPADASATNLDNDVPVTKFYVVNDGSPDKTFEYTAAGASVENYAINGGNTAPRGAVSTAAGNTVWVVDANKNVYVYNIAGGLLGSWSAGGMASNATVEGIATNGTDVWIVDARQDRVYRYTNAATLRSGTQTAASNFALNSGNLGPKDVVTDGTSLWVVNDSTTDKVFKYSLTGTLLGSWTITGAGSSPTGITLDPTGGGTLWTVDSGTGRVYRFDNARALTAGSLSPATSFALAAGNTNPQGIADPPMPTPGASRATAFTPTLHPSAQLATHLGQTIPGLSASKSSGSPLSSASATFMIPGPQGPSILIPLTPSTDQDLTLLATERLLTGAKRSRTAPRV